MPKATKGKRGPLSKVEIFYIENNTDKSVDELSKDLDRSVPAVEKHLTAIQHNRKPHVTGTKKEESKETVGNLMARKEGRGVTTMTPAASELSAQTRKKSSKFSTAIHRIKQESEK